LFLDAVAESSLQLLEHERDRAGFRGVHDEQTQGRIRRVRHGRFTPGHHIPVLPSDALYERKPDDVLVLAWRYAEPIMERHKAYRANGGRFILPLPEVSIV